MNPSVELIEKKETWEKFLYAHAPHALFQSWYWAEVQEKLGSRVWRCGLYDDGGDLVGIFLVVKIAARRGTFLHIRHGPIYSSQKKTYWDAFLSYVKHMGTREGAWFVRISPLLEDSQDNKAFFRSLGFVSSPIHAMDGELCWVLDLDSSEDEILATMRKTTRYEIRRGQKIGVQIIRSENPEELRQFYPLYQQTAKRHSFVGHRGISEEFEVFAKEQKALLFLAQYEKQVIAGAIILFYGNQAIYHHGASINTKIPASYLIQWEAIKEAKKRGMKVYNFWGIAPEDNADHPWRGITLFKKGFGGREDKHIHALDYPLSSFYLVSKGIESFRRMRKGY